MSDSIDADIIRFYRAVQSALGMGDLWMSFQRPDEVTLRWHPEGPIGSGGGRVWVEVVPVERIARNREVAAYRTAERMREAHRATVTDERRG